MINNKLLISVFISVLLLIFSCNMANTSNDTDTEEIVIGVVHTSARSNFFLEGVNMAMEEINQGGLLGKKIRTIVYDDKSVPEKGRKIAAKLAKNKDVIAVIGHENSNAAIPASIIYEKAGIVFISNGATDPGLTRYSGDYTFRNIPNDEDFGRHEAKLIRHYKKKIKKMIIFYDRDTGKSLSEIFKEEANAKGIEIIATRSYFSNENDFKSVISMLKKEYKSEFKFGPESESSAIFISGTIPASAILIKQLREMDVNVPIFAGNGLDSPDLWAFAGKAAEGTVVATVFDPKNPSKLTRDFSRKFESKFGFIPDTWAAQGYDALSVLAFAIEKSGSAKPILISTTLRFLEKWKGITGSYSFTPQGDITGKEIFFKEMKNGEFVFLKREQVFKPDLFNYIEDFTLRLPIEKNIPTIDPGLAGDSVSIEIAEQLFLGLTRLDPETYETVPELAKEWTADVSGAVYIFYMRQDAEWTNGEPVTAHDVVWAVQRNIDPDTKSPFAYMLYILKNAEAINKGEIKDVSKIGVFAPNDYTLIFELEYPASYFPAIASLMCYRPLPGKIIEKHGNQWTAPENIVTNGYYKTVLWEKGRGMFLEKNPQHYNPEEINIPEIRYYVISQSSMGLAMYENNELDIMGSSYLPLPSAELARIKKDPVLKDEYHKSPHFCTYAYAFNTRRPPVDNLFVRKAISAAINRQLIVDVENKGNGEPAATCTRPPAFGFVPPEQEVGISFDPLKAREWLAKAGYPGGKGFPEITLLYNTSDLNEKIAIAIQSLLKYNLSIDNIEVKEEDYETYRSLIYKENPYHMFRIKICGDYPDANSWLSHPALKIGWENREFAELLDKASGEPDPEQRKAYYKRAEQILCEEEAVAIPIYFEIYNCLVKPRVKGWRHMATGGQHIRDWYFEEE